MSEPTGLLGPNGKPISSQDFQAKKASAPALGERFGSWAGEGLELVRLPGGGTIGFDPRQLTLSDFRQMRNDYQINSSLCILTFMMHQMSWHIECENKKIADEVESQLAAVWSRLVRAMSTALWAGFSPNVLQWDNDVSGRRIVLDKVKDLYPEDCRVHWKKKTNVVPGTNGTKASFKVYDGIDQFGGPGPIPVENSYWYPLLMENGNYYGRRLLEAAFQPWFFSTLMHLFANRYYERFGEPTPVGRAPFEDEIQVGKTTMKGNQMMGLVLQSLRNRSSVVLPNDKTPYGDETNPSYDYTIEYLESQMRGADFERYMTRLDEEKSLAMFTPILMMRTADVGSYNLGTNHTQVYQWMLNAFSGDWAFYIDWYINKPIVEFNFGVNAPPARIKFMPMGKVQKELLQAVVTAMLQRGTLKPDTRELGELTGMTFDEVKVVAPETDPVPPEKKQEEEGTDNAFTELSSLIKNRVQHQVVKAWRDESFGTDEMKLSMGYKRQMEKAFTDLGFEQPMTRVRDIYDDMDSWIETSSNLGKAEYESSADYMRFFGAHLDMLLSVFTR